MRLLARARSLFSPRLTALGAKALLGLGIVGTMGLTTACGPTVELSGVAFGVAFTSPSGGGEDISTEVLPRVGFSRAVDAAVSLDLVHLELDADGTDIPATLLFVDDAKTIVIAPRAFLDPDTDYAIVVPAGTESADGIPIGTDMRVVFTTSADD